MLIIREQFKGRFVSVVAGSTADREASGSNPTQEMNLRGSTRPRCKLVPWEVVNSWKQPYQNW